MIGNKIKLARIEKKMSLDALAKKIGVDRQSIFNWESGKYEPRAGQMELIAEALSKSIEFFFYGKQTKPVKVGKVKNVA